MPYPFETKLIRSGVISNWKDLYVGQSTVLFYRLTWNVLFSVLRVTSVSCVLARILSRPASSVARWPENSNSISLRLVWSSTFIDDTHFPTPPPMPAPPPPPHSSADPPWKREICIIVITDRIVVRFAPQKSPQTRLFPSVDDLYMAKAKQILKMNYVLGCSFPVSSADFWLCLRKFCGEAGRGRLAGQWREFKTDRKSTAQVVRCPVRVHPSRYPYGL